MANLAGFDASTVPEQTDFSAVPRGQYVLVATASEMKPTKAGNGQFLNVTCEVLDGQYKGRKLWARMNLVNPNATAVQIGQQELGALCRAVGIIKPNDSSELHNKPFLATVDIEVGDRNRENNIITKYEAIQPGGFTPSMSHAPAPAFAAQPNQAFAAAPAAASTPPWQK